MNEEEAAAAREGQPDNVKAGAVPFVLARREVNELGEAVETRPLMVWERDGVEWEYG